MKKILLLVLAIHFILPLSIHAAEGSSPQFYSAENGAISQEETILLAKPETEPENHDYDPYYFIKAGGSMAFFDEDFREFLDYGGAVSFGVEQKITKKLTARIAVDLVMLKGDWRIGGDRESIEVAAEQYYPGYVGDDITAEDLPDANLGSSYFGGGEAVVTSAENLESIDIDTTLFLLPITFNAVYHLHEEEKKINPYIGGGVGFCLARREAESTAVKEESFEGPEYRIDLNDSELVTGLILQFFAGIEVPLKNNMKIVAEANTALYSLNRFDPIMEISYKTPNPDWYEGSDLSTWTYETPMEFGVFKEEFVSSIMIGLVIPF